MNTNYKVYILAAIVLTAGIAIGWIIKPTNHQEIKSPDHEMSDSGNSSSDQIWTCSMHPQIRQNEPGICPICEMDLIPLDNSLSDDDPTILKMTVEAAKLAQVETTIVGTSANKSTSEGTKVEGTVELDERSIHSQTAHVAGRLDALYVNFEGDYVKAGQKIASLYSTELLAASQELITAAQYNDKIAGLKEASIQKLKNWKITDAQIENILSTGKPIETIEIYADHSGYVLSKNMSQGDYVKQGQTIYTIGSTGRLWLIFNVYESDMASIKVGQNIRFSTPSLGDQQFNARITYIDPLMDNMTRTATVRAEISNPNQKLKPGMLLTGLISGPSVLSNDQVMVPRSAVLWTGSTSVVYVKLPDVEIPSYQFREVSLGEQRGEYVIVKNGVLNGEEIVTQGAFAIDAAAQLNNQMSMMNRNVTIKKDDSSSTGPSFVSETPTEFKSQLDKLVQSYIELKDALVSTDAIIAKAATGKLMDQLGKVDMTLLQSEAHIYWMDQSAAIKNHAGKILESKDIEEQRRQFSFLSQAMINSLQAFGTDHHTYFVQYCPMAMDNEGADWLSTEEQIRNPYFGDKMMKCGSVKRELK